MRDHGLAVVVLVLVLVAMVAAQAWAEPRVVAAGTDGGAGTYHVDLRGLDQVRSGSVLVAYRRVPGARGDAAFRDDPVWLESGRLQVIALGAGFATAEQIAGPPLPLPAIDEDGVPRDRVCVGDRLVESGSMGPAAGDVIGRFEHPVLFVDASHELVPGAREVLALWLSRFAIGGAVRVDVGIDSARPVAAGIGEQPSVDERIVPALGGPVGAADLLGGGPVDGAPAVALAQRRAARIARLVGEILARPADAVLATASWPADGVSAAGTVSVRLVDAVPRAELAGGGPALADPGTGEAGDGASPVARRTGRSGGTR